MPSARPVGRDFSPLDEELALLPSTVSPFLHQCIVRLGALLPFTQVPEQVAALIGVTVSRETVRRLTEEAGAAQVVIETEDLRQVPRTEGPAVGDGVVHHLSADGAMVPLRHGLWAEVRTLALGVVELRWGREGREVHTDQVSYFSRLCSAERFIDWVALPLHQRGTDRVQTVVAVTDGAAWLQDLISGHRPDAVRILDFPHAAEYLGRVASAAFGTGSREAAVWLDTWLPALKQTTPEAVIEAVKGLPMPSPEAVKTRTSVLAYLGQRIEQIRYARFQAMGYPIGSGMVESGNKLVVEARLKGAGMHWARTNVTPMVALRGVLCSGRWHQAWGRIWEQLGRQVAERRREGRLRRKAARAERVTASTEPEQKPSVKRLPPEPPTVVDGRPTDNHWWKGGYQHRQVRAAALAAKS